MIKKVTSTLRALSLDMIDTANSGHPGIALGAAPIVFSVFEKLKFNPEDDNFYNKDRFILSAGHGSSLLYAAISVFTNGLSTEDLKKFRALGSITPGHPEKNITPFVEVSTGPLGQGVANAVGFAIAERKLATLYNKPNFEIIDHYTYALVGDGCLMEGVAIEALDIAAKLNLNKLIVLYDSNNITIEGAASLAQDQNTEKIYKAKGFFVQTVKNGDDEKAIMAAIDKAKKSDRPNLIIIKTVIGFKSSKAGTSEVHGAPLGTIESAKVKASLGLSSDMFKIDSDVLTYAAALKKQKLESVKAELKVLDSYKENYKQEYENLIKFIDNNYTYKSSLALETKDLSTRDYGGKYLNDMANFVPNLIGGAADVAPSTKQYIKDSSYISADSFVGRNIHFGVREHAMVAILNGVLAHKGFKCFCSTFMSFADYCKPALRMAALMDVPLISVFTSDSIGAGEDGPTHQPVEQLVSLRAIPNMVVLRPADEKETAASYEIANTLKGPSSIILTRQKLPMLKETDKEKAKKGFYVVYEPKGELHGIILASGSELCLAVEAAKDLAKENKNYRVVSCFSAELYGLQSEKYKAEVLPNVITNRIVCEAGSSYGLAKFAGLNGKFVCIDEFGKSGRGEELFEFYNISKKQIIKVATEN